MSVDVALHRGALPAGIDQDLPGCGAVVCFEGVVRPQEDGRELEALAYEAYEPMTTRQLRELGESVLETHGVSSLAVEHSTGPVAVGGVSFRLLVGAPHRREALRAVEEFIDRMKADVALWKRPVFAESPASSDARSEASA